MRGRIWGYAALALAVATTTASMAAVDETAPRIFFTALVIAAVYAEETPLVPMCDNSFFRQKK